MLEILKNISGNPLFVIDKSIPITKYIPISIASSNSALTFDVSSSDEWEDYINNYLNKKAAISSSNDIVTTHQDIAYDLNTSREVISRLLKKLEKSGDIKSGRNKITLLKK